MEAHECPAADVVACGGPEVRHLLQLWDHLSVDDGLLKRRYESIGGQRSWRELVVPSVLRNEILQELHAGALEGHLGEDKTIAKVHERFYWPGLWHDVIQWLRTCPACATCKSPPQKNRAPLQMVASGFPMQIFAVGILGLLPESTAGNLYILVVVDYLTKWLEAYVIPNQEAITVARKLVDQPFCRFSPPEQLHSDQGKEFESDTMQEVCKILGLRSLGHPPITPM